MEVQELLKIFAAHPQVSALDTLLNGNTSNNIFLKGLNGSGAAMTIASLFLKRRGNYVCILNDQEEAGYFYHDLMQLTGSNEIYFSRPLTAGPSNTDISTPQMKYCGPKCSVSSRTPKHPS